VLIDNLIALPAFDLRTNPTSIASVFFSSGFWFCFAFGIFFISWHFFVDVDIVPSTD
jgi:hypothetical protein